MEYCTSLDLPNIISKTRKIVEVRNIAGPKGLRFADPFKALYHYRKHGTEFMEMCSPKFYLGELPSYILRNGQLTDVCKVTVIAAVS